MEYVELSCDTGMVQIDSLHIDEAESIRQARAFQAELPQKADAEAASLRQAGARLVVGDIPPLAFAAAAAAGVPAVAIGNFTWDWIYEGYADQSPFELSAQLCSIYQKADRALRLPTAGGFAGLERITRDIPFVARQSRREPDDVRRELGLPPRAGDKPLVLVSFGGYGLAGLDSKALNALGDYRIATTDLPARDHAIEPAPGLLYLSEERLYANGYRYEDLVRAADVVVTKPGYGIVSESIANDTALLYTSRGRFVEYEVFVREMPRFLRTQFIEQDDLLKGKWGPALQNLLSQPAPPERPALNGADVAAEEILTCLRQNRM